MKYDYENVLEYAVEQGEARGREEGRSEGLAEGEAKGETKKGLEIAKKLFAEGMDINFVSKVTSLSIKEFSVLR